jgi:hypothetical protein
MPLYLGHERLCLGSAWCLQLTHRHGRTAEDKENATALMSVSQHSSTRISGRSTLLGAAAGVGVSASAAGSKSVMMRMSGADAVRVSTSSEGQEPSSRVRQSYEQV